MASLSRSHAVDQSEDEGAPRSMWLVPGRRGQGQLIRRAGEHGEARQLLADRGVVAASSGRRGGVNVVVDATGREGFCTTVTNRPVGADGAQVNVERS